MSYILILFTPNFLNYSLLIVSEGYDPYVDLAERALESFLVAQEFYLINVLPWCASSSIFVGLIRERTFVDPSLSQYAIFPNGSLVPVSTSS